MTIHCRVITFLSADTSRDLVTLTFDRLTLNKCHTWQVSWPNLPPSMKILCLSVLAIWFMSYNVSRWLPLKMRTRPLRMHRITWPVSRESKTITFLESPTPICPFTMQLWWLTMKVIEVICEKNARPCVKRRMSFCACAKSRDLLKVP